MNKRIFAALATVVLGFGVIAGIGTYVAAAKNDPGVTVAESAGTYVAPDGTEYPQVKLSLNSYPNSLFEGHHGAGGGAHPDWVSYGLGGPNGEILSEASTGTNFQVPAHTAVTITIFQYDSGETLNNDFFAHVRGTVGGTATFVKRWDTQDKVNVSKEEQITNIPADMVGHTFTIHGMSDGQDQVFVNVPLMLAEDDEVTAAEEEGGFTRFPTKTTFTFITGDEGEYIWNCEFPCGDGTIARFGNAMSSMGYMSGHFTVKG
ncbi:MAG: hypothetical protein F2885_03545 [Actinobacteria bacterium]|uniref:Unannotated protein n=1 Tax=freshwater metagenome TaxID=449393 RepID=A0A6J7PD21_9ZZZZ|nr:hypothetical protein [Actinomycetota bacterium]